jgi:hypothetical protein
LLAVALQVVLPVAMMRAAVAGFDPLGHATICVTDPGDAPAQGGGAKHNHACPLCPAAVGQNAVLTDTPRIVPAPSIQVVATVRDPGRSPGPRGPPTGLPPSRAPPHHS